jgi:DNA polymerase gamma 1
MEVPTLPTLGTQISEALRPNNVHGDFKNCRLNFTVQASGAEMLSVMLVSVKWLSGVFRIPMNFVVSIHDELCFMCKEEYALEGAMILQLAHLYTWSLFFYQVGINDLPLSRIFASEIAIDQRFRKSPTESTITISQTESEEDGEAYSFQELVHLGALQKLHAK